jgi:hypothetical protein
MEGSISRVDITARSMRVKSGGGTEASVYWNDSTRVQGTLEEAELEHTEGDRFQKPRALRQRRGARTLEELN